MSGTVTSVFRLSLNVGTDLVIVRSVELSENHSTNSLPLEGPCTGCGNL